MVQFSRYLGKTSSNSEQDSLGICKNTHMRWITAGESHGQALSAIIEGMPAHVVVTTEDIDFHLARRRLGVGRGARQNFEADKVTILGGVASYTQFMIKHYLSELKPNSGSSIKDQVSRLEARVDTIIELLGR